MESGITLTHPAENSFRRKNHILFNHSILLYLSVDSCNKSSRCSLFGENIRAYKDWPDRGEFVKSLRVEKLPAGLLRELEEAARKVISNCVAEYILGSCLGCHVAAFARSDEDEFALHSVSDSWFG